MKNRSRLVFRFRVSRPWTVGFLFLNLTGLFFIAGYWLENHGIPFVFHHLPGLRSHLSNFVISLLWYLLAGFILLRAGVRFRVVAAVGAVLALANVVCETVMGFMNTTDWLDALSGIIGTLVSFFYLLFLSRHGLVAVPPADSEE